MRVERRRRVFLGFGVSDSEMGGPGQNHSCTQDNGTSVCEVYLVVTLKR